MKNKTLIIALLIVIVGIVGIMASGVVQNSEGGTGEIIAKKTELATIYKSPTCGCCGVYVSYMKKEGYEVNIKDVEDLSEIKKEYSVPYELESCHTMEIAGYVVEGHIPEEAVSKLLSEKPDIKGIGMAGMPSGSPGMPGPKNGDFVIYEINNDGSAGEVFMTI